MGKIPVFVLGLQRSGTTWLANMLFNHPDVAAVSAAEHHGIHESIFFSHFANFFGSLDIKANRVQFLKNLQSSDYGILSQLPMEWFDSQSSVQSYSVFFRSLMDEVAERNSATYWLEKSPNHTLIADKIRTEFPDAWFIGVVRQDETLIASRLNGYGRTPPQGVKRWLDIVRACAVNSMNHRFLLQLEKRDDKTLIVHYEHLQICRQDTIRKILNFIGLSWCMDATATAFNANSSFISTEKKITALSALDKLLIKVFRSIFDLTPLMILLNIEKYNLKRRGIVWPTWCWKRDGRLKPK